MSEQNKEVVIRYYEQVINGRDLDAVGDYFADERIVEGVRRVHRGGRSRLLAVDPDRNARR
jgi:hypothetical protein